MERPGSFLPPYVSTGPLARWLMPLLLLLAALSSISAGFEISELRLLDEIRGSIAIDEKTNWAYSRTRNILLATRVVSILAVATLFMGWLHRARVNVRAFGCRRFHFPRMWAVIGFLVPVFNFFRPYQVLSEVWRASDPRAMGSPVEWKLMPLSRIVPAWWGMLIASTTLELIALMLLSDSGESVLRFAAARGFATFAHFASTAACILAYLVVSGIGRFQQTQWAILSHEAEVLSEFSTSTPAATVPADAVTADSI